MDSVTERVAKAICDRLVLGASGEELALAALDAMHEPNDAMLEAARDWSYRKYGMSIGNAAATEFYQTMLDAAQRKDPS